jgi:hypothetical protein
VLDRALEQLARRQAMPRSASRYFMSILEKLNWKSQSSWLQQKPCTTTSGGAPAPVRW